MLVASSALGLPGWPANVLVPADEPLSYCGSPEMDDYFNSKCGGAVASVVGACCDETPAPTECDTFRMACINAHVTDGKCANADDCDAGCEFFNSVAASCCPHVRSSAESVDFRRAVVKAGEPEGGGTKKKEAEKPPPEPACYAISNDEYYNNLSGGMLANITSTCCGYAAVVTGMPSAMQLNFPAACDDYMRECNTAQVKLGACTDADDCDMGMQVMNQIIDSCCHRPLPPGHPPSPPPPKLLCADVDDESASAKRDVAALHRQAVYRQALLGEEPVEEAPPPPPLEAPQVDADCEAFVSLTGGDNQWCQDNCAAGWCPADTCQCEGAASPQEATDEAAATADGGTGEAAQQASEAAEPWPMPTAPPVAESPTAPGRPDCLEPCGNKGGYCDWCSDLVTGQGSACCHSSGAYPTDPAECLGVTAEPKPNGEAYHSCVLVAPAAGGDAGVATADGTGDADATATADGDCKGRAACKGRPGVEGETPPTNATVERVRKAYNHGKASNDVAKAGLLVHCFDGTESMDTPWRPCTTGTCHQFQWWWSASFINLVQPDLIGTAGIILAPEFAKVECSWDTDMGSMNSGCGDKKHLDGTSEHTPFPPNRTEDMLNVSMAPDSAQHAAGVSLGVPVYNEVVVNSTWFIDHLPGSIEAIVYFEDSQSEPRVNAGGVVAKDTREVDKLAAYTTYVALLDAYNLTEKQIPLLAMSRGAADRSERSRVTDMSSEARAFLATHEKYSSKGGGPKPDASAQGRRRLPDFPREKFDHAVDTINEARRAEEAVAAADKLGEEAAVRPAR